MKIVAHRIVDEALGRHDLPAGLVPKHHVIVPPAADLKGAAAGGAHLRRRAGRAVREQRVVAEEPPATTVGTTVTVIGSVGFGARPLRRALGLDELQLPQQLRVIIVFIVFLIAVRAVVVLLCVCNAARVRPVLRAAVGYPEGAPPLPPPPPSSLSPSLLNTTSASASA